MNPVISILITFVCMVGFIATATLAINAHVHYRTGWTILMTLLAILCLWGLSASADMTRRAFDNRTENYR